MKRNIRGAAFAAAPFLLGSAAHAQWSSAYSAPRAATVDANGARMVRVEAGAGSLRVEGRPGLRQVQVRGTARSSSQQILNEIKLIAERRGDVVFIKSDIPEQSWRSSFSDNYSAALDLIIEIPQGIDADVTVDNIRGDVRVSDGSGDINVRNVTGSFTVKDDGSGGIHASDIRGSVVVENDGSGSIEANTIGRDFKVESKGSGSITYHGVSGEVDIPERHRSRQRREQER